MDLTKLYKLRTDFTIIGLTGRTGSGCSRVAESLASPFDTIEKNSIRDEAVFTDEIFKLKYKICKNFVSYGNNWTSFEIIRYVDVLLFYILNKIGNNKNKLSKLLKYYKEDLLENNQDVIERVIKDLELINSKYKILINEIKNIKPFDAIKSDSELEKLGVLFFNKDFQDLKQEIFECLEKDDGYFKTRCMLHWVSCNIRKSGNPLGDNNPDIKYIFSIADLLNKLIKAKKVINDGKPTKIVIDSLRNSLEIMFFKERYSAFYMVATKDVIGNTKSRIKERLNNKISNPELIEKVIDQILELDEIEYRTKDFSKGMFSSPDVENCIQKSDYHIFNLKKDQLADYIKNNHDSDVNGFFTREEQLMKLVSLIQQPGLITPSSAERSMQIANTAKFNSGCISRKVGAAITDSTYSLKSIGWNDVAKGHTPCNLRSITDYFDNSAFIDNNTHYSPFEKGIATETSSYKYKGKNPGNFKEAIGEFYKESFDKNKDELKGKNCSFCFKTVHNHFEGEANQVHTRSLHAEENAMLQITKYGGIGSKGGYLFTTASPCELCSKKAYQLGITKIFFIDPYPGIAVDQILRGGKDKTQPKLIPFYGAIGNAYYKLYDSFMSYKDEIAMTLEVNPKQKISKEVINALSNSNDPDLKKMLKNVNLSDDQIINHFKELLKKEL